MILLGPSPGSSPAGLWPALPVAVIAVGLLAGSFSVLATALRRWVGEPGLWLAVAAAGCLVLGLAWAQSTRVAAGRIGAGGVWAAFVAVGAIAFLAPAAAVRRVERRTPRGGFARTVGYGVGSAYLALAVSAAGLVLVAALVRVWRAAAA